MARSLVIVESPAKAGTLGKFLGKDFTVTASYGHVRDLDRKGLSVDRSKDYKPEYRVVPGKEKTVAELTRLVKKADRVFLAADPDREGEAICWHLHELLKKEAPNATFHRAEFNEITKTAVQRAIEKPGKISKDRVGAQQARRIIDRLVGYEVSELLWNKVWRGLSAGRVQTVALRIIVERETEREAFVAIPYFSVPLTLAKGDAAFPARVVVWRNDKLNFDGSDPRLATHEAAEVVRAHVAASELKVVSVEAREKRQNPAPPFTTPKLQQAAARSLGYSVRKTMTLAQRLYEGRAVGEHGTVGLISYMRTDSVRVADEALVAVRAHIQSRYGDTSLPAEARRYKSKKDAQDAHEAIRPTTLELPPEAVAPYLEPDELKLYRLIWNRFVASQMNPAVSESTTVDIEARRQGSPDLALVRATGTVLKDPGFRRVYGQVSETEAQNAPEDEAESDDAKVRLPAIAEGDALVLREASVGDHETQPPPRFNEASLVKFMEENGIGRPSTYADILRKIEQREYVRKQDRRFIPTPLGRLVVDLMKEGFEEFFQTEYTARMEEELDDVEEGKIDWRQALRDFDGKFSKDRDAAKKKMHSVKAGLDDAGRARGVHRLPPDERPRRHLPRERPPAQAADGQGGPLHRLQRLSGVHLDRRHPRDRGGPRGPHRSRGADLRRVRQPDAAAHGQERLELPRLHGLPEVPQRHLGPGLGRQGRSEAGRAHRREVPGVRPRPREAPRPLRRVRLVLELPELPLQAAEGGDAHGRHLPGVPSGQDPRAQGPLRPVLRLLALPGVHEELPRAAGAEALPEVRHRLPARAREEGRQLLRLRGRGLRLRRFGRRPRPVPARDRGHRGSPPGRARRRDDEGRREEDAAAQEGAGGGGGARRRSPPPAKRPQPERKPKAKAQKAATAKPKKAKK